MHPPNKVQHNIIGMSVQAPIIHGMISVNQTVSQLARHRTCSSVVTSRSPGRPTRPLGYDPRGPPRHLPTGRDQARHGCRTERPPHHLLRGRPEDHQFRGHPCRGHAHPQRAGGLHPMQRLRPPSPPRSTPSSTLPRSPGTWPTLTPRAPPCPQEGPSSRTCRPPSPPGGQHNGALDTLHDLRPRSAATAARHRHHQPEREVTGEKTSDPSEIVENGTKIPDAHAVAAYGGQRRGDRLQRVPHLDVRRHGGERQVFVRR